MGCACISGASLLEVVMKTDWMTAPNVMVAGNANHKMLSLWVVRSGLDTFELKVPRDLESIWWVPFLFQHGLFGATRAEQRSSFASFRCDSVLDRYVRAQGLGSWVNIRLRFYVHATINIHRRERVCARTQDPFQFCNKNINTFDLDYWKKCKIIFVSLRMRWQKQIRRCNFVHTSKHSK